MILASSFFNQKVLGDQVGDPGLGRFKIFWALFAVGVLVWEG